MTAIAAGLGRAGLGWLYPTYKEKCRKGSESETEIERKRQIIADLIPCMTVYSPLRFNTPLPFSDTIIP